MGSDPSSSATAAPGAIGVSTKALLDRIDRLEQAMAESMRQAAAHAEHLTALTTDVARDLSSLSGKSALVETHMLARPYMSSPEALTVHDGQGRKTMGYATAEQPTGNARDHYRDFEALFRGSRAEIQARQQPYLEFAKLHTPVLDLGCGRGEFLELLHRDGLEAYGVDVDAGMVAEAVESGVDARVGDVFDTLADCADESIGLVFSAQVIEHLAPPDMSRLLAEAHRVLRPDGVAVIETVNVHSLRAYRFFWLDLTHTIPVFPESVLQLARSAGFAAAVIFFPQSTGDLADDLANAGDYALVAARTPEALAGLGLLG